MLYTSVFLFQNEAYLTEIFPHSFPFYPFLSVKNDFSSFYSSCVHFQKACSRWVFFSHAFFRICVIVALHYIRYHITCFRIIHMDFINKHISLGVAWCCESKVLQIKREPQTFAHAHFFFSLSRFVRWVFISLHFHFKLIHYCMHMNESWCELDFTDENKNRPTMFMYGILTMLLKTVIWHLI